MKCACCGCGIPYMDDGLLKGYVKQTCSHCHRDVCNDCWVFNTRVHNWMCIDCSNEENEWWIRSDKRMRDLD